jgi:hypothetical protein
MQDGAKVLIKPGKREVIKTAHDTPALAGHAEAFNLYELALIGAGADNSSSGDLQTARVGTIRRCAPCPALDAPARSGNGLSPAGWPDQTPPASVQC